MDTIIFTTSFVGLSALAFAGFKNQRIHRVYSGSETMPEISLAIREDAMAFLKREYRCLCIVSSLSLPVALIMAPFMAEYGLSIFG